jgi:hypothetical protein
VTTTYFIEITDGSVSLSDEVTVAVIPLPEIDLGPDGSYCEGGSYILDAGPGYASYFWSNGESSQTIEVSEPGVYWCEVSNDFGCAERDTIEVAMNPLPDVNLGEDYNFCENTTAILDAGDGFNSYLWSTGEGTRTIEVSEAGEYWVEVTSDQLCSNSDTIFLDTDPLPQQSSITSGPTEVDLNATSVSTFTSSEAQNTDSYNWSVNPPEAGVISGNGTSIDITWDESYTGSVQLSVTTMNECGTGPESEAFQVLIYNSLSVNEIDGIGSIMVFPNPTTGVISLKASISKEAEASLYVTDMNGRIIISEQLTLTRGAFSRNINLEDNRDGIYTLTLKSGEGVVEKKIILNK